MNITEILDDHGLWLRSEGGARANLSSANLSGADLSSADLSGANLSSADLSSADLYRANLSGADLSGANLSSARLSCADLSDANLSSADLSSADLSGATGILCAGTDTRGYRFVGVQHESGPMIKAGCRWFSVAEARAHWSAKGNRDALARVNLIVSLMSES